MWKSLNAGKQGFVFILFSFLVFSYSCNIPSPYYQKQVGIPEAFWTYDNQPVFTIHINDTAAEYRMFLVLRHDEEYPYGNIWIRMSEKAPKSKKFNEGKRIEKKLASSEGIWLGKGLGGIWEHKLPLTPKETIKFSDTGTYKIKLEQLMRVNPLPSVLNVGLIIEKR